MNRSDAHHLLRSLEANFQGFSPASELAINAFAEALEDIPAEFAAKAAKALLYERYDRPPNGPAIRHRVMEDAGLLAPSWPEALQFAADVHHGRRRPAEVPGPVLVIDSDALHASYTKSWEVAYEAEARAHDSRVLAPGGIAELIAAAEWLKAARWRAERLRLAQQCASEDPAIALVPGPATPLEALEAIIARRELESGSPAELAVPLEPGERLSDGPAAPRVAAMLARVRSMAAQAGE